MCASGVSFFIVVVAYAFRYNRNGDIEHLRWALPKKEAKTMKPGQLYWITDRFGKLFFRREHQFFNTIFRTPHESLPLKRSTFRQFFRIVTSDVSFWYKDHSTPNPLGVLPDPDITKIVVGNKFSDEGFY